MRNISIALLGSGFVAEFFMQGLVNVNGQQVLANYSRSRKRAQAFGQHWGIPEFTTDLGKLIDRPQ
jgi:predicted dehydrogenase